MWCLKGARSSHTLVQMAADNCPTLNNSGTLTIVGSLHRVRAAIVSETFPCGLWSRSVGEGKSQLGLCQNP